MSRIQKGWYKLSDRHKYHYFVDGLSECLRYAWYPLEGESYDGRPLILDVFDDNGDIVDLQWDDNYCLKCQRYELFGKSEPPHLPKCARCGQFTSDPQFHQDAGWYEWDEYFYCRRCEDETAENRS